jgi:two-component system response regulator PilR (NtrC family)
MTLSTGGVVTPDHIRVRVTARASSSEETVRAPALPLPGNTALENQLENIERDAIVKALEQTRYNKTAAAKLLGMSFRALRYRIKKLGIE